MFRPRAFRPQTCLFQRHIIIVCMCAKYVGIRNMGVPQPPWMYPACGFFSWTAGCLSWWSLQVSAGSTSSGICNDAAKVEPRSLQNSVSSAARRWSIDNLTVQTAVQTAAAQSAAQAAAARLSAAQVQVALELSKAKAEAAHAKTLAQASAEALAKAQASQPCGSCGMPCGYPSLTSASTAASPFRQDRGPFRESTVPRKQVT